MLVCPKFIVSFIGGCKELLPGKKTHLMVEGKNTMFTKKTASYRWSEIGIWYDSISINSSWLWTRSYNSQENEIQIYVLMRGKWKNFECIIFRIAISIIATFPIIRIFVSVMTTVHLIPVSNASHQQNLFIDIRWNINTLDINTFILPSITWLRKLLYYKDWNCTLF